MEKGLQVNSREAWKYLALLLRIIYGVARSKSVVTTLLREEFPLKVGHLCEHMTDFQQGNYLVELLSNCFPRKHADKPGVVLPPMLWDQEQERNTDFFGSLEYPFRGRHGDAQVTKFVYKMFRSQLENTLQVDNICYGINAGNMNSAKKFRQSKNLRSAGYCYVQVIRDCIYLYDGEGLSLELDRRFVDVVKTLKGCIRMNIKSDNCIRSSNKIFLKSFVQVKWFQLQSKETEACECFYRNISNHRKVSESSTFLLLNHADEVVPEQPESEQSKENQATGVDYPPLPDLSRKPQSENSQLATPENSDAKIQTDEWEINLSSELQGTVEPREEVVNTRKHQLTPENVDENTSILAADLLQQDEQSPLVLAQKRRMIREASRTLESLKREFALRNDRDDVTIEEIDGRQTHQRSPSLIITKFESKTGKKTEQAQSSKIAEESLRPPKTKVVKSIKRQDINVLDTIFGTPGTHKRAKRQRELKNFKPLVEVPSQEKPKAQTGNQRKKNKQQKQQQHQQQQQQQRLIDKQQESSLYETENPVKNKENTREQKPREEECKQREEHEQREERLMKAGRKRKQDMQPPKNPSFKVLKPAENSPKKSAQIMEPMESLKPAEPQATLAANIQDKSITEKSDLCPDSTTVVSPILNSTPFGFDTSNAFTDKLQEQIFSSITLFSNELARKMTIINKELNNKIMKELSEKYQNLFHELQKSFQNDTEDMFRFVGEIKDMLNLPEEKLIQAIRSREFGYKDSA